MKWWTQLGTVITLHRQHEVMNPTGDSHYTTHATWCWQTQLGIVTTQYVPHEAEKFNKEQLAKRKMTHRHWASKTEHGCKRTWPHGSWTKLGYPSSFTHLFNIFHLGIRVALFYWLQHCYDNGRNVSTYEVIFSKNIQRCVDMSQSSSTQVSKSG